MSKIILIVEDYNDTREIIRVWVEMWGFLAVEAVNGLEAIECVKEARPDLVLMDIGLPLMDGLVATHHIRELSEGKNIPIIAITAYGDGFDEQAFQAGCNKVIGKPFEADFLRQIISDYLLD
jgi:two-component system cell cycle response regulator DivK